MTVTSAQHAAHLDAEQAEGDRLEELANDWRTAPRREVIGEWVCEVADACTCAGLAAFTSHEPYCGLEPIGRIDPSAPDPPPSPEDEETYPPDPERTSA